MQHSQAGIVEVRDVESTLELGLERASALLNSTAVDLGANAVAVFHLSGSQVEITYYWSGLGEPASFEQLTDAHPDWYGALQTKSGTVEAGTHLAKLLREWIAPQFESFLLFPWRVKQQSVIVTFCFAASVPPQGRVPDAVAESLNLIGLATWSVKEVARLRTELKIVTNRLAGRKIVERAKGVLQVEQGISEERAYEYLRGQSRKRRITLSAIAEEVIRHRGRREAARLSAP